MEHNSTPLGRKRHVGCTSGSTIFWGTPGWIVQRKVAQYWSDISLRYTVAGHQCESEAHWDSGYRKVVGWLVCPGEAPCPCISTSISPDSEVCNQRCRPQGRGRVCLWQRFFLPMPCDIQYSDCNSGLRGSVSVSIVNCLTPTDVSIMSTRAVTILGVRSMYPCAICLIPNNKLWDLTEVIYPRRTRAGALQLTCRADATLSKKAVKKYWAPSQSAMFL